MSTKKSAQKAALAKANKAEVNVAAEKKSVDVKSVKSCVQGVIQSAVGKWVSTTVKKTAALCASFVTTTLSFGMMVEVTLWLDEHWLHHLFEEIAGADPVLGTMFHYAKYVAVAIELLFWLRGVYLDCKDHSNHGRHGDHSNHASIEVVETEKEDETTN